MQDIVRPPPRADIFLHTEQQSLLVQGNVLDFFLVAFDGGAESFDCVFVFYF